MLNNSQRIYSRIFGGLGNQLFIYAYSKALSLEFDIPLVLDHKTGFVKDSYSRVYRLNEFCISEKKASTWVFLYMVFRKKIPYLSRLILPNVNYFNETEIDPFFELQKFQFNSSVYLEGYWQNYNCFEKYKDELRINFQLKGKLSPINIEWISRITEYPSIAIHIRRVQYDTVLDLSYYIEALDILDQIINNYKIFVFSDEIEYCKKHLISDKEIFFIDHNIDDEVADFILMSKCDHFIIANSTFSWWAAWLGSKDDKVVIAPKRSKDINSNFYYPSEWILI